MIKYIGKCLLIEDENDRERVLVVGDLHLGYEGSLRESGVMIPVGIYKQILNDFDEILEYLNKEGTGNRKDKWEINNVKVVNKKLINNVRSDSLAHEGDAEGYENHSGGVVNYGDKKILNKGIIKNKKFEKLNKIIILGDIKHEFGSILKEEWQEIGNFLGYLKEKCDEVVVIEGNHDKILFPVLKKLGIEGRELYIWREFAFFHGNKKFKEIEEEEIKYWVMGHWHPAIVLTDGTKKEKYKCFLVGKFGGKEVIFVPSFFPLVEGSDARDLGVGGVWEFDLGKFDVLVVGEGYGFNRGVGDLRGYNFNRGVKSLGVLNFGKLGKLKC